MFTDPERLNPTLSVSNDTDSELAQVNRLLNSILNNDYREISAILSSKPCLVHARNVEHPHEPLVAFAARTSATNCVGTLLDSGAEIDGAIDASISPLHAAIWAEQLQTIEFLLARGANIHALDRWGHSYLDWACWTGNPEIIKPIHRCISMGLLASVSSGNTQEARRVLASESNSVNATFRTGLAAPHLLFIFPKSPFERVNHLNINRATLDTKVELLALLVKHGVNLNSVDSLWCRQTPLHLAMSLKETEIATLLVHYGADTTIPDVYGRPPIEDPRDESKPATSPLTFEFASNERSLRLQVVRTLKGNRLFRCSSLGGNQSLVVKKFRSNPNQHDVVSRPRWQLDYQAAGDWTRKYKANAQYWNPAHEFHDDCAGYLFMNELPNVRAFVPSVYGIDREEGAIAIEDLGEHPTVQDILLNGSEAAARQALRMLAILLADINGASMGHESQYYSIRDKFGPRPYRSRHGNWCEIGGCIGISDGLAARLSSIESSLKAVGLSMSKEFESEFTELAAVLRHPGNWLAYVHDTYPANYLIIDQAIRAVDFGACGYQHASINCACARMYFPFGSCVNRIPDDVVIDFESSYRSRLTKYTDIVANDADFYKAIACGCAYVLITCDDWSVELGFVDDREEELCTRRQRALTHFRSFIAIAESSGYLLAMARTARNYLDRLLQLWGGVDPLPLYPAFRQGNGIVDQV